MWEAIRIRDEDGDVIKKIIWKDDTLDTNITQVSDTSINSNDTNNDTTSDTKGIKKGIKAKPYAECSEAKLSVGRVSKKPVKKVVEDEIN